MYRQTAQASETKPEPEPEPGLEPSGSRKAVLAGHSSRGLQVQREKRKESVCKSDGGFNVFPPLPPAPQRHTGQRSQKISNPEQKEEQRPLKFF